MNIGKHEWDLILDALEAQAFSYQAREHARGEGKDGETAQEYRELAASIRKQLGR